MGLEKKGEHRRGETFRFHIKAKKAPSPGANRRNNSTCVLQGPGAVGLAGGQVRKEEKWPEWQSLPGRALGMYTQKPHGTRLVTNDCRPERERCVLFGVEAVEPC